MYTNEHYLIKNKRLNSFQLSKLHTFEVAARHCSFALAADELSISPSAVSHRMTALEEELGFKLFQRYHRRVELTAEGERVYWTLRSTLEHLNQEIFDIKSQELSGSLTVYSRPSIAQCWLVPKLADFTAQHPSINLTILTGNENVNFRGYGIDLAIYFDAEPPQKLAYHYLMNEQIMPVCSPEYAEKYDLYENPANLSACTLLHDQQAWSHDSDTDEWSTWAKRCNIELPVTPRQMRFDRSDLAIIAAINHTGVAMGRKNLVEKRIRDKQLVAPFTDKAIQCEPHYYVCTLPQQQNPKVAAFIQWLQTVANVKA